MVVAGADERGDGLDRIAPQFLVGAVGGGDGLVGSRRGDLERRAFRKPDLQVNHAEFRDFHEREAQGVRRHDHGAEQHPGRGD